MNQRGFQRGGASFGPPVTPPVIKNLIIANAAVFLFQMFAPSALPYYGAVVPGLFWKGYLWQAFTYMFLHGGMMHIAFNMFALWMFGTPIALIWGAKRFLRYYLLCGTGAGVIIAATPYAVSLIHPSPVMIPTVGASGAVMGIILAYCLTWPDRTIQLLFPPIPIKAIWFIPLVFFLEFTTGPENISHAGHLGGVLVGWILLRRDGHTGSFLPSRAQLRYRWERYKMRKRLRDASRNRNGRGPF